VVVFEVNETTGKARRLQEIDRIRSEDCGSDFLDANMEKFLEFKLRKYRAVIPAYGWESLMYSFSDLIRPIFNPDNDDKVSMHTPSGFGLDSVDDQDIGLVDGLLCFTATEPKSEVFGPAVGDILELIRDLLQRQQKLEGIYKALFMLGEFGSCRYMLDRAEKEFKDFVGLVAAPLHPSMAISQGAVMALLSS
jgi:hypothetical protein